MSTPNDAVASTPSPEPFGWLVDDALGSNADANPPAAVAGSDTTDASALPTDTQDNAKSASVVSESDAPQADETADEASKTAEAKAGEETQDDATKVVDAAASAEPAKDAIEYTAEEKQWLAAYPKKRWAELTEMRRSASLRDSLIQKPGAETVKTLKELSPSGWEQTRAAAVDETITDPKKFVADIGQIAKRSDADAVRCSKLVDEVIEADRAYVIHKLTGKEVTPEYLTKALEFYERTKGGTVASITDGASAPTGETPQFTDEKIEEFKTFFPEDADALEQLLRGAGDKTALQAKVSELESRLNQQDTGKQTEAQQAQERNYETIRSAIRDTAEDYMTSKVSEQYKLKVTDAERKHAPLVATFKDMLLDVAIDGSRRLGLPFVETGLMEYAKDREGYTGVIDTLERLARAGERDNAVSQAAKLSKYADPFIDARMKHERVVQLQEILNILVEHYKQKPKGEKFIPGQTPADSQRREPANAQERLSQIAADAAFG